MKAKLLSSYISLEGTVVAMTKDSIFEYARPLSREQSEKLLRKLAKADEIDLQHWTLVHKKEAAGS